MCLRTTISHWYEYVLCTNDLCIKGLYNYIHRDCRDTDTKIGDILLIRAPYLKVSV